MSQASHFFQQAVSQALADTADDAQFAAALASLPHDYANDAGDDAGGAAAADANMWAISDELDRLLRGVALHVRPAQVLEFGAGRSTRALAESLAQTDGGALTSMEEDPSWCEQHTSAARACTGVDYSLIESKPRPRWTRLGLVHVFDGARAELARRGPFDLVVIDAPQYWLGRDGALPLIHDQLQPGALLIVDDAGRPGERASLYRWLRTYPGLRLIHCDKAFGGRGLAVLRFTTFAAPRLCLTGALTATRLALSAKRRAPRKSG